MHTHVKLLMNDHLHIIHAHKYTHMCICTTHAYTHASMHAHTITLVIKVPTTYYENKVAMQ